MKRQVKRPALRVANRKLDVANRKEANEIIMNTFIASRFMSASEIRELIVLLYINKHHMPSDWRIKKVFPYITLHLPKMLEKFMEDGVLLRVKKPKYRRMWYYYLTNIGNRYLTQKVNEIKSYEAK